MPVKRLAAEAFVHEGGTGGFRSFAAVVPQSGVAVAVLAARARGVGRLGMRLLSALLRP